MRIRMLEHRTGSRWDGQDWPLAGGELDVTDEEGASLCEHGAAVPVVTDDAETPEAPDPSVEIRGTVTLTPVDEDDGTGPDDDPAAAPKPIVNSPKAAWVDHAVSQGADPDEAAAMKKSELIAAYGNGPSFSAAAGSAEGSGEASGT